MATAARVFQDAPAIRSATPLLFGIAGPSGSGKTYSALRLAVGMQRVGGGDIYLVDTESNRALHYADKFRFRHVPFAPPFSPLDYIQAMEHCVKQGAKIVIVDSMSHEHEGPGGVLEWHEAEVERLMKAWKCGGDKANIPAWNKPKAGRRKLIHATLQMQANFIFCFRAKNKIKVGKKEVTQMGFMPIAGEEFVYELTAKALLLPGADGVPTLASDEPGERMMIKLPEQFRGIFTGAAGKPLDEDIGEQLARWAAGSDRHELTLAYEACTDAATFEQLEKQRAALWKAKSLSSAEQFEIKAASDATAERLKRRETVDRETGEVLPQSVYTQESAIAALTDAYANGLQELTGTWALIVADYAKRAVDIPLEIEAKYAELREALQL